MAVIDSQGFLPLALELAPQDQQINNSLEAAALLLHAVNASLGCVLQGAPTADGALAPLPKDWAEGAPGQAISLRYSSEESGDVLLKVELEGEVVKVSAEGEQIEEPNKVATYEFAVSDFFDSSAFPFTPPPLATPISDHSPLLSVFVSPAVVNPFFAAYKENVGFYFTPGTPSLSNEDLGPDSREASPPKLDATPSPAPSAPSLRMADRPGYHSDAGGPTGVMPGSGGIPLPGRGGSGGSFGLGEPQSGSHRSPFNVGGSDLDPLGGRPAVFPGFPGGNGPSFGGRGDGGGMFMGPGHPLFQGGGGAGGAGGGSHSGMWGGDGFLPRGGAPPGARFDPVGPMNGPPGGGVGGPIQGRGRGAGGPLGLGSRDPDWNGQPPSRNSDYDNMFS